MTKAEIRRFLQSTDETVRKYVERKEAERKARRRRVAVKAQPRVEKQKAKVDERTARIRAIRAEVVRITDNTCEVCTRTPVMLARMELHHVHGGSNRRSMEAVETCCLLCTYCHRAATDSDPGMWRAISRIERLSYGAQKAAERRADKAERLRAARVPEYRRGAR